MIKILIADDHNLVREGLSSIIRSMTTDMEVAGEAASGQQVIRFFETQTADLVLMDVEMPEGNGIETTRYLARHFPGVRVLMLTMADNRQLVREAMEAGAQGYLLKTSGRTELLRAIRLVAEGEEYFSADLTRMLLSKEVAAGGAAATVINGHTLTPPISKRELEVLRLIAQGYTNAQIADLTFTSKRTVESHRQSLLEKTGSTNTATLIRYAATHQLIDLE
jgi:DNA-binding NarL/FixJ family response regulator